jgi:hypothetical protein
MTAAPVPETTLHPQRRPSPPGAASTRQALSLATKLFAAIGTYDQGPRITPATPPNITDPYTDLLGYLDPAKRRGMIAWISNRYYDGWRPDRAEIGDLVAVELGVLRIDESIDRQHRRQSGAAVPDILPMIRNRITNPKPASCWPLQPTCTPLRTQRPVPPTDSHRDDPPTSPEMSSASQPGSPIRGTG